MQSTSVPETGFQTCFDRKLVWVNLEQARSVPLQKSSTSVPETEFRTCFDRNLDRNLDRGNLEHARCGGHFAS